MLKDPLPEISSSIIGYLPPERICTFPGCFRVRANNVQRLCMGHLSQKLRGKTLEPIGTYFRSLAKPKGQCVGPDCTRPAQVGDKCYTHYQQKRRGLALTPIKPRRRKEQAT